MADEEQPSGEKSPFGAFEQEPVREREAAPAGLRVRRGLRGALPLAVVLMVGAVVGGVATVSQDDDGGGVGAGPIDDDLRPAADVVRFAKGPPTPRPDSGLPRAVARAGPASELATRFVVCDGLAFYIDRGRFPTARDWQELPGGYVLSRAPPNRVRRVADELTHVAFASSPQAAAVERSRALDCAAIRRAGP
jgi:hypothetical protein